MPRRTLPEADLQRRDLTINALARDDDGQIIDPYHGRRDLEARLLRHVSPAFGEDPCAYCAWRVLPPVTLILVSVSPMKHWR